jgi:hypothetical protein
VGVQGIVLSTTSVSLSAMMYWAVTANGNGSSLHTVGLILMSVGAAGTLVLAFVFSTSRSSENTHHTFDRQDPNLDHGFRSIQRGIEPLTLRVLSSATTRPPFQDGARARGTSDCRTNFDTAQRI